MALVLATLFIVFKVRAEAPQPTMAPPGVKVEIQQPANAGLPPFGYPLRPLRLTQDAESNLLPLVAVYPDGRLGIAWQRSVAGNDLYQLSFACSPAWDAVSIASVSRPQRVRLSAYAGGVQVAWSQPMTNAMGVMHYKLGQKETLALELPLGAPSDLAFDGQGRLHVVWAQGDQLNYWEHSRSLTSTFPMTVTPMVSDLALALAGTGQAHLAWLGRELSGQEAGIFYMALGDSPQPIRVASHGYAPRLAVGPSGLVHLCWLGSDGLYYANGQDWATVHAVVTGPLTSDVFAFAIGPGEVAHFVWSRDGVLWYANSVDWHGSQRPLATQVAISGISMGIDDRGHVHIAWSALDEEGHTDIYYLCPTPKDLQLRVTYPLPGQVIADDVLIKAESNLLPGDVLRVEFYLQVASPSQDCVEETLISLGVDRDGRDEWSVPLHIAHLDGNRVYRVLVLGVDSYGRMAQAIGDWFTVQGASSPWVWLQAPDVVRGRNASVGVLVGGDTGRLQRLDLFFTSSSPQELGKGGRSLSPEAFYVGSYSPLDRPTAQWQWLTYDSYRLADGHYDVSVIATDRLGRRGHGSCSLTIDNNMFPSVEIVSPSPGAVIRGKLKASARVSDLDGVVQRVDFYAERDQPVWEPLSGEGSTSLSVPELLWLGSDLDGSDGWAVEVPVSERLDGDAWYVRAVAFDERGLAGSARSSGAFAILGRDRPYLRFLSPLPESVLCCTETVKLSVPLGERYLIRVQLYLQDPGGNLTYLGEMQAQEGAWLYEWDTRSFPDGEYSLLALGRCSDGHKSLVRSGRLLLQNARPSCRFVEPAPNQILRGAAFISLEPMSSSVPIVEVCFYYEDETGRLRLIGCDDHSQNGWGIVWDTTTALDGAYELVAWVTGATGYTARMSQPIVVSNVRPTISFQYFTAGVSWQGFRRIFWEARSPLGRPLSVTVEYSPDDGRHWLLVAKDLPASESFVWNTAAYPDSTKARLRLGVTDGSHYGQAISPPFVLNNVNESPQVALLAPKAGDVRGFSTPVESAVSGQGSMLRREVYIAWQADDPDGDSLSIDLEYRRGQGEWLSVASRLPNTGFYVWETARMPEGEDYALRITVTDPAGARGVDVVEGIRLIADRPPTVRLLAPKGGTRLGKETVILWRATSEDEQELLIDLYYSDNAGQTWLPLAEGLPNSGYYVWQTSYLPVGAQYRIRVVARGRFLQASAESEGVFSVGDHIAPQVALLAPAPGSSVAGVQCIRWSVANPGNAPLYASLRLSPAGKATWQPLALDMPHDGLYLWDTRNHPDGAYELQVTISDGLSLASTVLSQPITISNRANHPPQVRLISPRGGECWSGVREISWRAWDIDGDVLTATLYLGIGGEEWVELATLDARVGHILWDTSQAPPSGMYRLRVLVSDGQITTEAGSQGTFYLLSNRPPQVRFISPDSQGKLLRGNLVTWVAEDVDNDSLAISLAISDDEGNTWTELASNLFNAGEYALDFTALKPGHPYRLRLCASDGLARVQVCSAPFRLAKFAHIVPDIEIISPQRGERWTGTQTVRWRASDPAGQSLRIDIECSRNGGRDWIALARGLRNSGVYQWDTRDVPNGIYLLRLTADNGQARSDATSLPLVVDNPGRNAPVVSMVCPRGGEVWSGTREVSWHVRDVDGDPITATLLYSLDMGRSWQVLAQGIRGRSYLWDTTTIPNCDRAWLRVMASDGQFWATDTSDGPFAVCNAHAPLIRLLVPERGRRLRGEQRITWIAAQLTGRPIKVTLEVSLDAGRSWSSLATGLPAQGSYLWDTSGLPENSWVSLRVIASDGLQSAIDSAPEPFTVLGDLDRLVLPFYLP